MSKEQWPTLEEVVAQLERMDLPLHAYKDLLLTKQALEYRNSVVARRNAVHDLEARRKKEAFDEAQRVHEERMQNDLAYRWEQQRKETASKYDEAVGKPSEGVRRIRGY